MSAAATTRPLTGRCSTRKVARLWCDAGLLEFPSRDLLRWFRLKGHMGTNSTEADVMPEATTPLLSPSDPTSIPAQFHGQWNRRFFWHEEKYAMQRPIVKSTSDGPVEFWSMAVRLNSLDQIMEDGRMCSAIFCFLNTHPSFFPRILYYAAVGKNIDWCRNQKNNHRLSPAEPSN